MQVRPIAKTDYTYCVNDKCKDKDICARYHKIYQFEQDRLYSFCNFNEKTCVEGTKQ